MTRSSISSMLVITALLSCTPNQPPDAASSSPQRVRAEHAAKRSLADADQILWNPETVLPTSIMQDGVGYAHHPDGHMLEVGPAATVIRSPGAPLLRLSLPQVTLDGLMLDPSSSGVRSRDCDSLPAPASGCLAAFEQQRGELVTWWMLTEEGVQHGLEWIGPSGVLELIWETETWTLQAQGEDTWLVWNDSAHAYGGLEAWDEQGKRLDASVAGAASSVVWTVDASRSVGMVAADPLIAWSAGAERPSPAGVAFGRMHALGDFDADGTVDLAAMTNSRAWIYRGLPSGFAETESQSILLDDYGEAAAGDFDGDGADELVLTQYNYGRAQIWDGAGAFPLSYVDTRSRNRTVQDNGDFYYEQLGTDPRAADYDGDGYIDLIIGSVLEPEEPGDLVGDVTVLFRGSATGLTRTRFPALQRPTPLDSNFGSDVDYGDFDGDGIIDLVVTQAGCRSDRPAAPGVRPADAFVFPGTPAGPGPAPSWSVLGADLDIERCTIEHAVAAGDTNGDGYEDLLLGGFGASHLVLGGPTGLQDTTVWSHQPAEGLCFYWDGDDAPPNANECGPRLSLARAIGDYNGDGYDDISVASAQLVEVFFGGPRGPATLPGLVITELTEDAWKEGGALGDLDGDGFDELLVTDPYRLSGIYPRGAVAVFFGEPIDDPDADGVPTLSDCHPYVSEAAPGLPEIPGNDLDDDCDGWLACFTDLDGDGFAGDTLTAVPAGDTCTEHALFTAPDDCDDADPSRFPGAFGFVDDDIDQDCDATWMCTADLDGDGYTARIPRPVSEPCSTAPEATGLPGDCNDDDPDVNPLGTELAGNGEDDDCDGIALCWLDADGDGWSNDQGVTILSPDATCDHPGMGDDARDCDDADPDRNPDVTDDVPGLPDMDCDGQILCYADEDEDGFGDPDDLRIVRATYCERWPIYSSTPGDCNDQLDFVNPSEIETAGNRIDEDCDGLAFAYWDLDDDGWGGRAATLYPVPPGHSYHESYTEVSPNNQDCDDADPSRYPDALEVVGNDLDEDCDHQLSCFEDLDEDGDGSAIILELSAKTCLAPHLATTGTDCDDLDPTRFTDQTEVPGDGIDHNCDGIDGFHVRWRTPLTASGTATLEVVGSTPGAAAWVLWSIAGPGQTCYGNACVELAAAVALGPLTLDARGNAFVEVPVPANGSLWVQGVLGRERTLVVEQSVP